MCLGAVEVVATSPTQSPSFEALILSMAGIFGLIVLISIAITLNLKSVTNAHWSTESSSVWASTR